MTKAKVAINPHTLATPANMEKYAHIPGVFAYSPYTGDCYSGSAGDYWNLPKDIVLKDAEGFPMILVVERVEYVDVKDVERWTWGGPS